MHSNSDTNRKGTLFIVATPIGNMGDITLRAIETLKSVDIIAAEDTRHTGKLLSYHNIKKNLVSLHEHNENTYSDKLVEDIINGKNVALVSDAGTPSVSDPGYTLVKRSIESGVSVVPIPGVSAAISALSVSGLPTDSFVFLGFPPKKSGKRQEMLKTLLEERRTLIFYESPNRISSFITDLLEVFGERNAVLGREMTKLHEEFIRGNFSEILESLSQKEKIKGECTLVVEGSVAEKKISELDLESIIKEEMKSGKLGTKALSKDIAERFGIAKGKVYETILKLKNS